MYGGYGRVPSVQNLLLVLISPLLLFLLRGKSPAEINEKTLMADNRKSFIFLISRQIKQTDLYKFQKNAEGSPASWSIRNCKASQGQWSQLSGQGQSQAKMIFLAVRTVRAEKA